MHVYSYNHYLLSSRPCWCMCSVFRQLHAYAIHNNDSYSSSSLVLKNVSSYLATNFNEVASYIGSMWLACSNHLAIK